MVLLALHVEFIANLICCYDTTIEIDTCTYIYIYIHMYMYVYICMSVCMCIYIYMLVCIHIYIYVEIYGAMCLYDPLGGDEMRMELVTARFHT